MQRQLGHASIKLTVDTYGRWLPMGNKAAVDRLDDRGAGGSDLGGAELRDSGVVRRGGFEPPTPRLKGPSEDTPDEPSVDDYEPEW